MLIFFTDFLNIAVTFKVGQWQCIKTGGKAWSLSCKIRRYLLVSTKATFFFIIFFSLSVTNFLLKLNPFWTYPTVACYCDCATAESCYFKSSKTKPTFCHNRLNRCTQTHRLARFSHSVIPHKGLPGKRHNLTFFLKISILIKPRSLLYLFWGFWNLHTNWHMTIEAECNDKYSVSTNQNCNF